MILKGLFRGRFPNIVQLEHETGMLVMGLIVSDVFVNISGLVSIKHP